MNRRTIGYLLAALVLAALIFSTRTLGFWLFITLFGFMGVCLVISVINAIKKLRRSRHASQREFGIKMTARFMGLFFITGSILYAVAFTLIGTDPAYKSFDPNNVELIIRSMICSLDMFMLDIDSNILDRLDKSGIMKGLLVCQAALSFMCTVAMLVSLVFSRARAYYLLHKKTKVTADKNHLYIFFGVNDNVKLLARDINRHDPKSIIIFTEEANVREDDNDSWDSVINLFTHRQRTFDIARDSNALVAISSRKLSDVEDATPAADEHDVLSMIELDKIRDLIRSLERCDKDAQLHVFFLSENEDENIRGLINLSKDSTVMTISRNTKIDEKIYCHARYNGPNRVVEDLGLRKGLNVEIIDSSHLAVDLLKSRGEDQPVRTAHLSEKYPTTVTRPLESLVIGFGEVGRDAFRFIYEFGSFIEMIKGKPIIAKPRITAIDSNMHAIDGAFINNAPGIRFEKNDIELLNMDYSSKGFYTIVLNEKKCENLNYIVIALGNDDENISLAANIFNRIRRYRADMTHLIIMVRCIREEKRELMQKIADHYNRGCGDANLNVIRLFGNPEEIYSYATIIKDALTCKGITFMESYQRLSKGGDTWKSRRNKLTGLNQRIGNEIIYPNIDDLRKLRRQENQDLANAFHSATKMWLLKGTIDGDSNLKELEEKLFDADGLPIISGEKTWIRYPHLSERENEVMLNLAMLEHARWSAAHEILGYQRNEEESQCDERTMRHNCLIDWAELDAESDKASSADWKCDYKLYDFGVVNTSIFLHKKESAKSLDGNH